MTGCNHHSVGMRGLANWNTRLSQLHRHGVKERGDHCRGAAPLRLFDVCNRQMAPDADRAYLAGGSIRPVAAGARLRPPLWLPRWRDRPVATRSSTSDNRSGAAAEDAGAGLSPLGRPDRQRHRGREVAEGRGRRQAVLPLSSPLARPTRRIRRRSRISTSTRGKFDAGWDVVRQQWYQRQKQLGIIPRIPNSRRAIRASSRGSSCRRTSKEAGAAVAGGFCRLPRAYRRADRPVDGSSARRPASSTTRSSS